MLCDTTSNRLKLSVTVCMVLKRFKKRFVSLHSQDSRLYGFPNTPLTSISIPPRMKVCMSLDDFKVKTLRGGFQRRPELLLASNTTEPASSSHITHEEAVDKWIRQKGKSQRIQRELVLMAESLCHSIRLKENPNIPREIQDAVRVGNFPLVLDIGCGDGTSTEPLLQMGYSCVGVDVNHQGLWEFQRRYRKEGNINQNTANKFENFYFNADQYVDFQSTCGKNCDVLGCKWAGESQVLCMSGKIENVCHKQSGNFSSHSQFSSVTIDRTTYPAEGETIQNIAVSNTNMPQVTDVVRWDLRHGLPFKAQSFDMAVSISFLQWLFYGERHKQLNQFFSSLRSVLQPHGQAVIQFYPRSASQLSDSVHHAMQYFQGVLVGDYPHIDRGRKLFLVLFR